MVEGRRDQTQAVGLALEVGAVCVCVCVLRVV